MFHLCSCLLCSPLFPSQWYYVVRNNKYILIFYYIYFLFSHSCSCANIFFVLFILTLSFLLFSLISKSLVILPSLHFPPRRLPFLLYLTLSFLVFRNLFSSLFIPNFLVSLLLFHHLFPFLCVHLFLLFDILLLLLHLCPVH